VRTPRGAGVCSALSGSTAKHDSLIHVKKSFADAAMAVRVLVLAVMDMAQWVLMHHL
jgi:hypothetical protein